MPKQLSPDQVEQFWNDGFLFPVDAFDGVQARRYRSLLEQAEQDHPGEIHAEHRNNAHYILKFLDEIAHHPVILDVMEDLLGPDVLLTGTVLFIKEPKPLPLSVGTRIRPTPESTRRKASPSGSPSVRPVPKADACR